MLGDRSVTSVLVKLLDDENSYVRLYAAHALGRLGDNAVAVPVLIKLFNDKSVGWWLKSVVVAQIR